MRLEIRDAWGTNHVLTSRNPDMIARWLMDTLNQIKPDPDMPAVLFFWPTWVPGDPGSFPDTATLGTESGYPRAVCSARDVITELNAALDRQEAHAAAAQAVAERRHPAPGGPQ